MNEQIRTTIDVCERFVSGRADALNLPRAAAAFLHTLVHAMGARRAVEIGTSYGYSGLWIAAGLQPQGGTLLTIDCDAAKSARAETFFEDAGLTAVVTCRVGQAADVLAALRGDVDFVLNDADKPACRGYIEQLLPRLMPRAVVVTDNTLTHAEALADFVGWIRGCGAFQSVHLPIGNGFEMSVRTERAVG